MEIVRVGQHNPCGHCGHFPIVIQVAVLPPSMRGVCVCVCACVRACVLACDPQFDTCGLQPLEARILLRWTGGCGRTLLLHGMSLVKRQIEAKVERNCPIVSGGFRCFAER
jgi:hypothetical protein